MRARTGSQVIEYRLGCQFGLATDFELVVSLQVVYVETLSTETTSSLLRLLTPFTHIRILITGPMDKLLSSITISLRILKDLLGTLWLGRVSLAQVGVFA